MANNPHNPVHWFIMRLRWAPELSQIISFAARSHKQYFQRGNLCDSSRADESQHRGPPSVAYANTAVHTDDFRQPEFGGKLWNLLLQYLVLLSISLLGIIYHARLKLGTEFIISTNLRWKFSPNLTFWLFGIDLAGNCLSDSLYLISSCICWIFYFVEGLVHRS